MLKKDVKECLESLSSKKCEGFDRIPVCVIKDCSNLLLYPLFELLNKIYHTGSIPDQWKVSKIIPIFKKGNKTEIDYNVVTIKQYWELQTFSQRV